MFVLPESFNAGQFQNDLIEWFKREQRQLPWRENRDPYRVWVSEIMLQQTRVDTVIPYFLRFMEKFPTPAALAQAEEEEVLKAWEGLGYYSRARNLQSAVREVMEQYGGNVPDDPRKISSLKGVGPYTAGAISSIAFQKPEPAVDGNVMRVMSRVLSIWDDIARPKTRKLFEEAIRSVISKEDPSAFNQGIMELGALVCTPKSPSCLLCPVREHCRAFHEGVQHELPVKSKKKEPRPLEMGAAVIWNDKGEVLIHKRPAKGLLANLWEFPNHETQPSEVIQQEQLTSYLIDDYGVEPGALEYKTAIKHVFSHLVWHISVYEGTSAEGVLKEAADAKWVSRQDITNFPFPVSHQKIMKALVLKEDENGLTS
ncbi:A/G-specific adenine glycosylase [Bacillus marinisedimentorum]|uniref:A/G-specific adenine glycosylase n=1 Tax=Bacillus marinisedimentorum TaxID=1821260 RepID=UPI0008723BB2|nr:A/G-specific adenine glycosylase [Bacillus marinisedimentorum]